MALSAVLYFLQRAWSYFSFLLNLYEFTSMLGSGENLADLVQRLNRWINTLEIKGYPADLARD